MVVLARLVRVPESLDRVVTEKREAAGGGAEKQVGGERFELIAEPMIERNAEAHFAAGEDFARKKVTECFAEEPFTTAASIFELGGQRGGELDEAVVENRRTALETVGHGSDIDFGHQVAGQISRQIAQRGACHGVAAAATLPCGAEEGAGIGRELSEKIVAVEVGALPLLKNADPIEVAARRRQRDGFAETLDAAEERFLAARGGQPLPEA